MTHTLISFLGKARQDPATGYRTADYRFDDGTVCKTPFFGLALTRHLQPGRLVILGTAGSMWDVLVEHLSSDAGEEELRLRLIEASTAGAVDAPLLEAARPLIERALGRPCAPRLIPYGRDAAEQTAILETMADAVPEGRVSLDLTHGFRHLAALGFVSALFLERVRGLEIAGMYYGALEMTERDVMTECDITPVLRLDGLTSLYRWVSALDRFDHSGDYGVFAPLLGAEGFADDQTNALRAAAFFERTGNPIQAREKLSGLHAHIDGITGPIARLFKDQLARRIAWFRGQSRDQWELALADAYRDRADYLRTALYLQEAWISRQVRNDKGDINDYDQREAARKKARNNGLFDQLTKLRNAMAHGLNSRDQQTLGALRDENSLRATLGSIRKGLFG